MKRVKHLIGSVALLGAIATFPHGVRAETTEETTTTTTSESGTVSSLNSGALIVQGEAGPTPTTYSSTKTTTYVDENGNPISVETVKSGVPVTVYYSKGTDGPVATKVVIKKSVTGDPRHPTTTIEEKRTTVTP